MARPRIEIDQDTFEGLCEIHCTLKEVAGFFKCSEDTIERWCERTYGEGFADVFGKYCQAGKISLRRYQYQQAQCNPKMAIWLGKQWLGQTEKIEAKAEIETFEDLKKMLMNEE